MATSTALYLTHALVGGNGSETGTLAALLDTYAFYIIPAPNPDGYVYTWESDRFWWVPFLIFFLPLLGSVFRLFFLPIIFSLLSLFRSFPYHASAPRKKAPSSPKSRHYTIVNGLGEGGGRGSFQRWYRDQVLRCSIHSAPVSVTQTTHP